MIPARDLAALRAFVAAAELSSFSKAAKTLGVSPSAISQAIRGLEERYATQLLVRTTRSVTATATGRALSERAALALRELEESLLGVQPVRAELTGTVRVHSFRVAGDLIVAPLLPRFADEHPEVVLDITLDDAAVDPVAGGFDVAIRLGEVIDRDLIAVRLGPDLRQLVVASPAYLARYGAPRTPQDLAGHRCIRWRWPGWHDVYAWEFRKGERRFTVAVGGTVIVNDRELALRAAIDGVGIAFPSEQMAGPAIADGRLISLLNEWSAPFPGLFLCYPRQRYLPPTVRAFIDMTRKVANEAAGL